MLFLPLLCYPVGNVTRDISFVDFHPCTCSLGVLKFFLTLTQASSVQDVMVSDQLRVRCVYVQPDRSFSPPIQVSSSRTLQSTVVLDHSPFGPLLYHVRSLLSLFLSLLTTMHLHQKRH